MPNPNHGPDGRFSSGSGGVSAMNNAIRGVGGAQRAVASRTSDRVRQGRNVRSLGKMKATVVSEASITEARKDVERFNNDNSESPSKMIEAAWSRASLSQGKMKEWGTAARHHFEDTYMQYMEHHFNNQTASLSPEIKVKLEHSARLSVWKDGIRSSSRNAWRKLQQEEGDGFNSDKAEMFFRQRYDEEHEAYIHRGEDDWSDD